MNQVLLDFIQIIQNSDVYKEIKLGYPELELQRIENDQSKINSFYDFYLSSLAFQELNIEDIPDAEIICLFPECFQLKSFASSYNFSRHVSEIHSNQLPGNGEFLKLERKKFLCEICQKDFARKVDLTRHFKSLGHHLKKNKLNKQIYEAIQCELNKRLVLLGMEWKSSIMWHKDWHENQISKKENDLGLNDKLLDESLSNSSDETTSSRYFWKGDLSTPSF